MREKASNAVTGRRRHLRGALLLLAAIGVLITPGIAFAAAPVVSTNLPPTSPAFPDASLSVIRVFGALALVLGLFLGGVWLYKNWQRVTLNRGRPSQLHILEMKALGGKQALYVVGYQHQRLLLASSPNGVSLVSHLPEEDAAPAPAAARAPGVGSESFVQALQQAVQARPG